MFKLARFFKNYKKQFTIGPLFKLTEAIFELIVPLVMADMIDNGINKNNTAYIYKSGVTLAVLGVTGLICAFICQFFASAASQGVGTDIRNALFKHILSLKTAQSDKFGADRLIMCMTNDANQVQLAVAMLIRLAIRAPFLVIGSLVMTLRIDKVLSVIVFAVTPLIALAVFFIMKNIRRLFSNLQKKLEIISRTAAENLSGVRVVRAFSRQDYENKRFGNVSAEYKQIVIKTNKISALLNPLTSVIMNCGVIAILYFGQYRVSGGSQTVGSLTQGEITAFVNYMTQIFIALIVVMDIMLIFAKASVSASRINEVFDVKDEDEILTAPDVIAENVPAVALRNVSFSYGSRDKTVLKNINLSIAPGQTVGIIGITGAGKSTLVNLIIRLYDADAGTVEIYGKDIKTYSPNQLDAVFGYVPQSAVLFSGSIADNVRLGKANASADEIKAALKSAQAINFIDSLPDGIDHHVEEGGKNLSGGQRQRVAIARALVKQPNILILDDSASALDSVTDYNLRKEINTEFAESTVIIVAQRVASVKNADKIYVIDNGEIIDGGTHEYLYENCAVYGDICRSQSVKQL